MKDSLEKEELEGRDRREGEDASTYEQDVEASENEEEPAGHDGEEGDEVREGCCCDAEYQRRKK